MSYSGKIKEELSKQISHARNCQLAELAALIQYCGNLRKISSSKVALVFRSENEFVARKYFTLLKKAYKIDTDLLGEDLDFDAKASYYELQLSEEMALQEVLKGMKWMSPEGIIQVITDTVNPLLIQTTEMKRAYLRGVYLACGSMSDPSKAYHLEFLCTSPGQAEQLKSLLGDFDLDAKIVERKKYFVVYMKEGEGIVELLNIMEAHRSLMDLENLRIEKEIRNTVNRRVNCETANICKTVNAAAKQVADIELIRDTIRLENLPEALEEMARVRLAHPEDPLGDLGQYLDPPVGKSGVNHRLRKLSEIAQGLRKEDQQ